jgi:hypothetical protein
VTVQPGMVLDRLNAVLKPHGLWFPVDVSTSAQATIGGMAGNNSCGSRSIAYGNMVHNVLGIDAIHDDGTQAWWGTFTRGDGTAGDMSLSTNRVRNIVSGLHAIADRERDEIRRLWPTVMRRVWVARACCRRRGRDRTRARGRLRLRGARGRHGGGRSRSARGPGRWRPGSGRRRGAAAWCRAGPRLPQWRSGGRSASRARGRRYTMILPRCTIASRQGRCPGIADPSQARNAQSRYSVKFVTITTAVATTWASR